VVTAGLFRFSLIRFAVAIMAGRMFRFLLEGYLAIRYGAQAKEVLARYYPWIGLGLVIALVVGFLIRRSVKKRRKADEEPDLESGN